MIRPMQCHSERSEESLSRYKRPFAIAQGDMPITRNRTWQNTEN